MRDEPPQVLVTGRLWLGADGARSIGSVLGEIIESAAQEVLIVAYRLTIAVPDFVKAVERALARGCYVRLLLDRSTTDSAEDEYLERLLRHYPTFAVWDFRESTGAYQHCSLHAKMVVVDRSVAIVGSANFSKNGMVENHEMALRVSGRAARSLAIACDSIVENGRREGVVTQRSPM